MTLNFDLARRTRRFKDLTQGQLAKQIGVSADALAGWEQGEHEPTLSNAVAWARALGLDLGELLAESSPDPAAAEGRRSA